MDAMQQFLKKIGPVGSAIFLGIFVLYLVMCFTQGKDELKDYNPPRDGAYYQLHMGELARELRDNVAPMLPGIQSVTWQEGERTVTVTITEDRFFPVRRSLHRHFPAELLTLEKEVSADG